MQLLARRSLRGWCGGALVLNAQSSSGQLHWVPGDIDTQGKLRALGRFLHRVGEHLVASAGAVATADSSHANADFSLEHNFRTCGMAMCNVSEALLWEQWDRAGTLMGAARGCCGPLFAQEPLSAMQKLVTGSPSSISVKDALLAMSHSIEEHAENFTDICEDLESELFDAAGALRAAARLFTRPCTTEGKGHVAVAARSADALASSLAKPMSTSDIDEVLARTAPDERKEFLRTLARQYHPDGNPGREMEVLPAFLHVQKIREKNRWS